MGLFAIIFFALAVLVFLWAMSTYNRLVVLKNEIANAYGQIDVQLKRRYDLIPNLVETAKKYLSHERETLEAVISARAQALYQFADGGGDSRQCSCADYFWH